MAGGERGGDARRPGARRSGRRVRGSADTRADILTAARRQFGAHGYDRTSLRQIAIEAGVDPTLVSHFYGDKSALFLRTVELPFDPADVLQRLAEGPRRELGLRFATFILGVLADPDGRDRVLGLVRAAATEPVAAGLVRDLVTEELLTPLAAISGAPDARYRAGLAMSQVVGMAVARYIVAVEPLASAPDEQVAHDIGATLQRYLVPRPTG